MRKFADILQSLQPLFRWRGKFRRDKPTASNSEALATDKTSRLTLAQPQRRPIEDWQPIEDSAVLRKIFHSFQEFMYGCNRKTKLGLGETPKALWESGKLAGDRAYFYLQPWNDRGFLFEETPRGWVVARAEKISLQDQFMRERSAWDHVVIYRAVGRPGLLRVVSEQMGEGVVSIELYKDFMSQAFKSENLNA